MPPAGGLSDTMAPVVHCIGSVPSDSVEGSSRGRARVAGTRESESDTWKPFFSDEMLLNAYLMLSVALLLLVRSAAADDGYCPMSPQCRPGHEECGPLYGNSSSQFHVRDTSCSNGTPHD